MKKWRMINMDVQAMQKESKERLEELQTLREQAKDESERMLAQKAIDDFFLKDERKPKDKKEKKRKFRPESEDDIWYE